MAGAAEPSLRGPRLDHRGGAPDPRAGHEHPGAAQPAARGPGAAHPRRHQRLGRRLAGDARPRQPRGALAASRRPRARHRARRPHAGRAPGDLSGVLASGGDPRPGRGLEACGGPPRADSRACNARPDCVRGLRARSRTELAPRLGIRDGSTGAHTPTLRHMDAAGLAREDAWAPGGIEPLPARKSRASSARRRPSPAIARILDRVAAGERLDEADIVALFEARGARLRGRVPRGRRAARERVGDTVTYVVNRNINYTNICTYGCKFCAFSKGRHNLGHRDKPYDLDLEEIASAHGGGVGARRHRGVPAGRHQAQLHRRHLSRHRRGGEGGGARHPRARLLAAGDLARAPQTLGLPLARLSLAGSKDGGPRQPARHGGRDPRRRGARRPVPRQDQHRRSGSR